MRRALVLLYVHSREVLSETLWAVRPLQVILDEAHSERLGGARTPDNKHGNFVEEAGYHNEHVLAQRFVLGDPFLQFHVVAVQ